MDQNCKKFLIRTTWVFILTIALGWEIMHGRDIFHMPIFYHMFFRYDIPGAIVSIVILFSALFFALKTPYSWTHRCLEFINENIVAISTFVFFILSLAAYFIYYHFPLSLDEYTQYFQAQIFSEGRLWAQYPPTLAPWLLKSAFYSVYSMDTGRVISSYWPGFSILLAPFTKLGVPWILNPFISAATIPLLFIYVKKILPDRSTAPFAVMLTLSASAFMVTGISYFSMSAHLFLNLLYAFLLLNISPLRLFLAGLTGSLALVLHNPLPHFLFALPWILWIALKKNRSQNIAMLTLGYLPIALFLGIGWIWLKLFISKNGSAASIAALISSGEPAHPIKLLSSGSNVHFLSVILGNILAAIKGAFQFPNAEILWAKLFGILKIFAWSMPGLPILGILGIRQCKKCPHLLLWACSAALTLGVYIFVPFDQGHGWGFRYFHAAWLALPLLATGYLSVVQCDKTIFWKHFLCSLALFSLVFSVGLRFYQVHQFIGQHLSQLPVLEKDEPYICFINTSNGFMAWDLIQNDPFLREPVMILESINDDKDSKMIQNLFPESENIKKSALYSIWKIKNKDATLWKSYLE